jgi:hypothetical protein
LWSSAKQKKTGTLGCFPSPFQQHMEKHILSKSTFIRGTQCLKSLYLNKKRPFLRDRLSDAQRAVFKRGTDVGILAQQLFPDGIDLKPRSPAQYGKKVTETMKAVTTGNNNVLYEAVFQHDRLLTILDILKKGEKGWSAYEVKSSLKISETYLLDAAFQYFVITRAGVPLSDFYLVTLNPDYQRGEKIDVQQLFTVKSVLEEVKNRQAYVETQIEKEKEALQATSSPPVPIGLHCHRPYACDFLGHCWKKVAPDSVLYLDAFEPEERFERYYAGEDQPDKIPFAACTPLQQTQLLSAREKKPVFRTNELSSFFQNHLPKPVFLSVLSIKPAVPYLKGTRPYQPLVVAASAGWPSGRKETRFFIEEKNPEKAFISFLKDVLKAGNTVVTYDKNDIPENGPNDEIKKEMTWLRNEIIELKPLFKNGTVFHYLFRGDYSAEKVAQVLLKQDGRRLNPALTGMAWQSKLFERDTRFEMLKKETAEYLSATNGFILNLTNFLKSKI